MIKKSIIAILAIVAAAGLVFAAYGNTGDSNSTDSNDLQKQQNNNDLGSDSSSSNQDTKTEISASKAQEIAQKYIDEPGAEAGTPKLTSISGKNVYIVPIIDNGEQVGEIEIDAQTGSNLGGAGGVQ
ncbi:MAG: PepSY domain-containing protein [Methanobacterium sp.]